MGSGSGSELECVIAALRPDGGDGSSGREVASGVCCVTSSLAVVKVFTSDCLFSGIDTLLTLARSRCVVTGGFTCTSDDCSSDDDDIDATSPGDDVCGCLKGVDTSIWTFWLATLVGVGR